MVGYLPPETQLLEQRYYRLVPRPYTVPQSFRSNQARKPSTSNRSCRRFHHGQWAEKQLGKGSGEPSCVQGIFTSGADGYQILQVNHFRLGLSIIPPFRSENSQPGDHLSL